jgi:hypothetical protein
MLRHENAPAIEDDAASRGELNAGDGSLTLDWATAADEASLLLLFERAFGHRMAAEQWRWKYEGVEPTGSIALRAGEPVAFYGGIPRRVLHFGTSRLAVQISDVMVLPEERGILKRHGAFFLTTRAYAERYVGPDRAYAFAFGFPSERHARLGEHLGLYARVDDIVEATWTALDARPSVRYKARLLQPDEVRIVDDLWHRMSSHLSDFCIGVRDAAHVSHRFLAHPTVKYLPLLVTHRLTAAPLGLVVLRDHNDSGLELLDAIAEPASIPVLVKIARRAAARLGRERLFAWLTPCASKHFEADVVTRAGVPVPTIIWGTSPDLEKLRGHWWLTGGDSDFR